MLSALSVSGSRKTLPKGTEPIHPILELAGGYLDKAGGLALQGNSQRDPVVNRGWGVLYSVVGSLASVRACD